MLAAARLTAARSCPFLSPVLFSFEWLVTDDLPTMAVDARCRVLVNPARLDGWSTAETAAVLCHESHHVVRRHFARFQPFRDAGHRSRDPVAWNLATDAAINDDLRGVEGLSLPGPAVFPETFGLEPGRAEEEYYAQLCRLDRADLLAVCIETIDVHDVPRGLVAEIERLPTSELPRRGGGPGDGHEAGVDADTVDRVVRSVLADVGRISTTRTGAVPAGLRRLLPHRSDARPDWRRELRRAAADARRSARGADETSWRRPSRRSRAGDTILRPSHVTRHAAVGVIVDTSASMTDLLSGVLAEVDGITRASRAHVTVAVCDTDVHEVRRLRSSAEIELFSGGGTDLRPAFDVLRAERPSIDLLVVATDGHTPWPDQPPRRVPVVVVLVGSGAADPPPGYRVVRVDVSIPDDGSSQAVRHR